MRVVIATAEPRGAYHLRALWDVMAASGHEFVHLIPYDEPVQGRRWPVTTGELSSVLAADRLVVTGGSLSAWTHAVASFANARGVPVRFSELAFVPTDASRLALPHLEAVSAISISGARALAGYFGITVTDVTVTGNPILDAVPPRAHVPSGVLLVSTDVPSEVDPQGHLFALAAALRDRGERVVVSPHAREDVSHWDGFELAADGALAAAAQCRVAVGYLGSAAPLVASTGCPFVVLDPLGARRNLEEFHRAATSGWASSSVDALVLLDSVAAVPREALELVTGPVGGSAQRVVDFWVR